MKRAFPTAVTGFFRFLKRLDTVHWLADRFPRLTHPLRLISYAAYRSLELLLGRRHPHNRVVAQAQEMQEQEGEGAESWSGGSTASPAPAGSRRKILFFTVRGWFIHASTEAVLAKALQQRGADCHFFLCGGVLPQCDFKPGTDPWVTPPLCRRCQGFAERLLDAYDLPSTTLADLVDDRLRRQARERVANWPRGERLRFMYRDLPLGEWVRPSVQRSLLSGRIGDDQFSQRVLSGFLESAVLFVHVAEALLDRQQPDTVVMTNGLFFAERILLELARERGVHVVTYERGMPLSTMLLDHNRPVVDFDLDSHWPLWRDRPLTEAEGRKLDGYLADRAGGAVGIQDLWPRIQADKRAITGQLDLDPGRPLASLFTNVLWDSAVYGRDVGFTGMFEWITDTVRWFASHPAYQLVIRVHPSEVRLPLAESRQPVGGLLTNAFPVLPDNVRVVDPEEPISSYALMALSRAVLVYTSTIGLEAAVRGRPVVVAGRTHYRGRGMTVDVVRREDYGDQVEAALERGAIEPDELELARRYAHLFFFRYSQPFPWVMDTPRSDRRLTFDNLQDLRPGSDPVLDRICAGILEQRPFVAPPDARDLSASGQEWNSRSGSGDEY